MSSIQSGAERMAHELYHRGFLAGRIGALLTVTFFFSSRRRHTRFDCDWSSDVCSSDLTVDMARRQADDFCRRCDFPLFWARGTVIAPEGAESGASLRRLPGTVGRAATRSEERRVGKEGRCGWSGDGEKKKGRTECGSKC